MNKKIKKLTRILDVLFIGWMIFLVVMISFSTKINTNNWEKFARASDSDIISFDSLDVYRNVLYAGAENRTYGAEIRKFDGIRWVDVVTGGLGNVNNIGAKAMTVYRNKLYVGVENRVEGGQVWVFDGTEWTVVIDSGLGDVNNTGVLSVSEYNGKLYVGTENKITGGQVWSYDGDDWVQVISDGFSDANNRSIPSLKVYKDILFAGTHNDVDGAQIWKLVDDTWIEFDGGIFEDKENKGIFSMEEFKGNLYVGTFNKNGGQVWRLDYETGKWIKTNQDGFGIPSNIGIMSMKTFGSYLYVGTLNNAACPGNTDFFSKLGEIPDAVAADGDNIDESSSCECDGKITDLTLRYLGAQVANIEVVQRNDNAQVFNGLVNPNEDFSITGVDNQGTLTSEIEIYVNNILTQTIHTSCSDPVEIGMRFGDFLIMDGASRNNGQLCTSDEPDPGCGCGEVWRTDGTEAIIPEFSTITLSIALILSFASFILIRTRMKYRPARSY